MRRDRRHSGRSRVASGSGPTGPGRLAHWLPAGLVLILLVTAVASYRLELGQRWLGWKGADPRTDPAAVAPPVGLSLPPWQPPAPVAVPVPAGRSGDVDPAEVRAALTPGLDDRDLGRHVVVAVGDLSGVGRDFTSGSGPVIPASTTKLLTTTAALETLGPGHTFTTRVVTGRRPGEIVLVGGGDPYLGRRPVPADERATTYPERADVQTLARRTAAALREAGRRRVTLRYDDSLFTGPTDNPRWRRDYVPDGIVSPITALWVDQGRTADGSARVADPSLAAAEAFADALRGTGIGVPRRSTPGAAPAPAATDELAAVRSAPLADIVEHVLDVSDNEAAEVLARHVGLATSGQGSFAGGAAGVMEALRGLGIGTGADVIHDGSGLSRHNRVSTTTLLDVVRTAAEPGADHLRPVLTGLPVAGFTGSLTYRFDTGRPAGLGSVRAKTGTLTGVHSLAGVVTDRDGNTMAFVAAADRVRLPDNLDARQAIDELAADLAACRCSA